MTALPESYLSEERHSQEPTQQKHSPELLHTYVFFLIVDWIKAALPILSLYYSLFQYTASQLSLERSGDE